MHKGPLVAAPEVSLTVVSALYCLVLSLPVSANTICASYQLR